MLCMHLWFCLEESTLTLTVTTRKLEDRDVGPQTVNQNSWDSTCDEQKYWENLTNSEMEVREEEKQNDIEYKMIT